MKSKNVAKYLQDHPKFFDEYADTLADIYIPHPHNGKIIPISERLILTLKEKNQVLQNKLFEFMSCGEDNDAISGKMHQLSIALLGVSDFKELLHQINFNLHETFAIPHVAIRLWGITEEGNDYDEFATTSDYIHTVTEGLSQPYCGPNIADEIKGWLDEDITNLESFSLVPLRTSETIGLLVLGSPEPKRFFTDMGTLHLKRLGDLVSIALTRKPL